MRILQPQTESGPRIFFSFFFCFAFHPFFHFFIILRSSEMMIFVFFFHSPIVWNYDCRFFHSLIMWNYHFHFLQYPIMCNSHCHVFCSLPSCDCDLVIFIFEAFSFLFSSFFVSFHSFVLTIPWPLNCLQELPKGAFSQSLFFFVVIFSFLLLSRPLPWKCSLKIAQRSLFLKHLRFFFVFFFSFLI